MGRWGKGDLPFPGLGRPPASSWPGHGPLWSGGGSVMRHHCYLPTSSHSSHLFLKGGCGAGPPRRWNIPAPCFPRAGKPDPLGELQKTDFVLLEPPCLELTSPGTAVWHRGRKPSPLLKTGQRTEPLMPRAPRGARLRPRLNLKLPLCLISSSFPAPSPTPS